MVAVLVIVQTLILVQLKDLVVVIVLIQILVQLKDTVIAIVIPIAQVMVAVLVIVLIRFLAQLMDLVIVIPTPYLVLPMDVEMAVPDIIVEAPVIQTVEATLFVR